MNKEGYHIADMALENLQKTTQLKGRWKDFGPDELDGQVEFFIDGNNLKLYAEVKNEIRNHQLPHLFRIAEQYKPFMVIANHIFPKIKEELQQHNIAWLETNGNVWLKHQGVFLWVNANKTFAEKEKPNRAFTKTGLKAVFHFLIDEENWLNLPYREMAKRMEIGMANINYIINGLKKEGFLIKVNKDHYKLTNKKGLLEKWMIAYKERLQPTLEIGTFRFLKEEDFLRWKNLPINTDKTLWGGEPAGELYTHYLRPEILTLYTTETRTEMIKHYRLIPDPKGNVKVYRKFYEFNSIRDNVVHPLLVYTDLMNTGDRRCIETAEKIYDELLRDKI